MIIELKENDAAIVFIGDDGGVYKPDVYIPNFDERADDEIAPPNIVLCAAIASLLHSENEELFALVKKIMNDIVGIEKVDGQEKSN